MEKNISIVIANYNKASTLRKCLAAAFASKYGNFEVIVVDDNSRDNSVQIIEQFPCRLIRLDEHEGASKARNIGALNSSGDIIFFIDADCLLQEHTLSIVNRSLSEAGPEVILGGTYTKMPYDKRFFSIFQSAFVHFFETKNPDNPDYIAAHALIIHSETFKKSKGFPEIFLPIIEDVEFTHRLKREGYRLIMNPEIQVEHIFGFSFISSMLNAFKKARYWTIYLLKNRHAFTDSGTASTELKVNVASYFLSLLFIMASIMLKKPQPLYVIPLLFMFNGFVNRKLLKAFYTIKGSLFAVSASLYYTLFYALAVGAGTIMGIMDYLLKGRNTVFSTRTRELR
jgi:glycosyltransferase involved in cell wall biosynthesis